MKLPAFALTLFFCSSLFAQLGSDFTQRSIFNCKNLADKVSLKDVVCQGIFGPDTPDSEFLVLINEVSKTPDDTRFKIKGKNWHKNLITPFEGELKFTTATELLFLNAIDSGNTPAKGLKQFDSLYSDGWDLYHCEGYFMLREDSTLEYSGVLKGIFKVYLLYHALKQDIRLLPPTLMLKEPSHVFTGTYTLHKSADGAWAPFFWSSLQPIEMMGKGRMLPDLRIQDDGTFHPENWIIIPPSAAAAPPDWMR